MIDPKNCSHCSKDLEIGGSITEYRLKLSCEKLTNYDGVSIDVLIYPPLEKNHYFCGTGCLKRWLNANELGT